MAFSVALIDLDGTLWDSAPWYAALLCGDDERRRAQVSAAIRQGDHGSNAAVLIRNQYSKGAFERACLAMGQCLEVYPGAQATLAALVERGLTLGVVSNLPGWIARPMLDAKGMTQEFSVVQTAKRGIPAKPHPAGLRAALNALDAEPESAVYVGDSASDRAAAEAAGIEFYWAGWGYGVPPLDASTLNDWSDLGDVA